MTKQVIVLGAGVVGVTTAFAATTSGFDVTVIERESSAALSTRLPMVANSGHMPRLGQILIHPIKR